MGRLSLLTVGEVVPYLLRRGWLTPASVMAGDLTLRISTRRNTNFLVGSAAGPGLFLKQGIGPAGGALLAREAAFYTWAHGAVVTQRLRSWLPALVGYHPADGVLVVEGWPAARSLQDQAQMRGRIAPAVGAALGTALAALHALPLARISASLAVEQPPPWILSAHTPSLPAYTESSRANMQIFRTLQQFPAFRQHLEALHATWQPTALVHYDLKGANVLIIPTGPRRRSRLRIVDWEMVGVGDPTWDVGSVFCDYLSCWLLSIPMTGSDPPERFLSGARHPLAEVQPAIRAFWQAYAAAAQLPPTRRAGLLERAVGYAAARLLHTAFENSQDATTLSGSTRALLQLSFNILAQPAAAAAQLLGLPAERLTV